jgi:hypothetical protein
MWRWRDSHPQGLRVRQIFLPLQFSLPTLRCSWSGLSLHLIIILYNLGGSCEVSTLIFRLARDCHQHNLLRFPRFSDLHSNNFLLEAPFQKSAMYAVPSQRQTKTAYPSAPTYDSAWKVCKQDRLLQSPSCNT